jgi:DNA replication protein DnaC
MTQKANDLISILKELHLPEIRKCYESVSKQAEQDGLSYEEFLFEIITREHEARRENRILRYRRESKLPMGKTMDIYDMSRFKMQLKQQVQRLVKGQFIDHKENVLAFGNPGSGKTHLLTGLCYELINIGYRPFYITCEELVQDLLVSKRDLKLSKHLKRLDRFDVILLDDIGYVQQDREQMEVLFTFLAHRYERGSVMVTSNLPFSKWESIFKDPMTTAAAIDRLIHHCTILEMNVSSYRIQASKKASEASAS